jgi:hypothetical protein
VFGGLRDGRRSARAANKTTPSNTPTVETRNPYDDLKDAMDLTEKIEYLHKHPELMTQTVQVTTWLTPYK